MMTVAFVLSGGGACGDFEVGALRYLYDQGIRPAIICGTSVGAINGVKLAEGEGGPNQGLNGLEKIYLNLHYNDDMYEEEPWFAALRSAGRQLAHMLALTGAKQRKMLIDGGTLGVRTVVDKRSTAPANFIERTLSGAHNLGDVRTALVGMKSARALYNLAPVERKLRDPRFIDVKKVPASGIKLRLAVVGLESGTLQHVTESGQLLGASDFLLHASTALPETDADWQFAAGDWTGDGRPDLIAIQRRGAPSGHVEVQILSQASDYQDVILHAVTALPELDNNWTLGITWWDLDPQPDLVAIQRSNTSSHGTEITILSGASHFQERLLVTGTALPETDESWHFALVDWSGDRVPDLIAVQTQGTASGRTEVQILSGASGFRELLMQTSTPLPETGPEWSFGVADWDGDAIPDLIAVQRRNTATHSSEVTVLSGSSGFQNRFLATGTSLPETDENWSFIATAWNGSRWSLHGQSQILSFHPEQERWLLGAYNGDELRWRQAGPLRSQADPRSGHQVWTGEFARQGRVDILIHDPRSTAWQLGSFDGRELTWQDAGRASGPEGNGNEPGDGLVWLGDFDGNGRSELLVSHGSGRPMWLGAHDGQQFGWRATGEAPFADNPGSLGLHAVGDLDGDGRTELLLYSALAAAWWLGSYAGQDLQWKRIADDSRAGAAATGHRLWADDFNGDGRAELLFFDPAGASWWLGTLAGEALTWTQAVDGGGFGAADALGATTDSPFAWSGKFDGTERAKVLLCHPSGRNWWLGALAGERFEWYEAGDTGGLGDATDGRPLWVADFDGDGRNEVILSHPGGNAWWLGAHDGRRFEWSLAGEMDAFGTQAQGRPAWLGAFNWSRQADALVCVHRANTASQSTEVHVLSGEAGFRHTVDLVDAVMASAAIPGIFPPVRLLLEYYVDGGVRATLPIQAAVDAGATEIYAIVALTEIHPVASFERSNILEIAERAAMDVAVDQTMQSDTEPPRGWGIPVRIIRPTVEVHDILTIEPGLISISMAYGYMRAADVLGAPRSARLQCAQLSDRITRLRMKIWALEFGVHGRPAPGGASDPLRITPADAESLHCVRRMKREVRELVARRVELGGAVPPDAAQWSQGWERHTWDALAGPTPWDRLVIGRTTIEAEASPL